MNVYLAIAGALIIAVAVAHSYLGERYLVSRLLRKPGLPQLFGSDVFTKHTIRFAWHLTSLAWLGLAALLLFFSFPPPPSHDSTALKLISVTFFASAVLAFFGSRGRHLSWVVFLAVSALTWFSSL